MVDFVDFGSYTERSSQTAIYPEAGQGTTLEIAYLGLGLGGEAGEAVDVIKKIVRKGPRDNPHALIDKLSEELGDLMWYVGQICKVYNFKLDVILQENEEKLKERYG